MFTLHPNNFPEQFSTPLNFATKHTQGAAAVVQWLKIVLVHTGRQNTRMNKWWQRMVTRHLQWISFQRGKYETGDSLPAGVCGWALDEHPDIMIWSIGNR
jgi:hypothetical protein